MVAGGYGYDGYGGDGYGGDGYGGYGYGGGYGGYGYGGYGGDGYGGDGYGGDGGGDGGYGYGGGYGGGGDGYGDGGYGGGGYGDGYGYGYGDGSGDEEYWQAAVASYISRLPEGSRHRATALADSGATIAYWGSDRQGRPANGGSGPAVSPGLQQRVDGPLAICTNRALHATYSPYSWVGERLWLVALIGEVQQEDNKLAALQREIIAEIRPQNQPA